MESRLQDEIEAAINRCSAENESDTPDFILAEYLIACLNAFDHATRRRDQWHKIQRGEGQEAPPLGTPMLEG